MLFNISVVLFNKFNLLKIDMKRSLLLLLIIMPLFNSNKLLGNDNPYNNQLISKIQGREITCFLRLDNGLLLTGTDRGLYCCPGSEVEGAFSGYENSHYFTDCAINDLCQLDDQVYIATNNGLIRVDTKTAKIEKVLLFAEGNSDMSSVKVNCLYVCSRNRLWAGLDGKGAVTIIDDNIINYQYKAADDNSIANDTVYDICEDDNGLIWLATGGNSLSRFSINLITFERIKMDISDRPVRVSNMLIDNQQIIITTLGDGLLLYDIPNYSFEKLAYDSSCMHCINNINNVVSFDDALWYSSDYSGLYKNLHLMLQNNQSATPLSQLYISSIYTDNRDLIYGTSDGLIGIVSSRGQSIKKLEFLNKANEKIWATAFTSYKFEQNWVGTHFGELYNISGSKVLMEDNIHGDTVYTNSGFCINAMITDDMGNLWIGTSQKGVIHYDPIGEQVKKKINRQTMDNNGMLSNTINGLVSDSENNLWVATAKGLVKYNYNTDSLSTIRFVKKEIEYKTPLEIYSLIIDNLGQLWAGTNDGLWKKTARNDYFVYYDNKTLSEYPITTIYQLDENVLLIGTTNSLYNLVTTSNSLREILQGSDKENPVKFILRDKQNNLWIGKQTDILKYANEEKKFYSYRKLLENSDIHLISDGFIDTYGKIYLGTSNGTYCFNPEELIVAEEFPTILLHKLVINNREIKIRKKYYTKRILKHSLNDIHKIVLPRQARDISLVVSNPYYYTDKISYSYCLKGYSKKWIKLSGAESKISYTNLPFGVYHLDIGLKEITGDYKVLRKLKIKIRRPIWRTWYFLLIVIGVSGFLINKLIKSNREKVRGKLKDFENELAKRKEDLDYHEKILESEKRVLDQRAFEEKVLRYHSNGLAEFSDTLSKYHNDIDQLMRQFILKMVEFVGAHQGVVYRLNDNNPEDPLLEIAGIFSDNEKLKRDFKVGEGYVGTCFKKGEAIIVDDITDSYSYINSGLGEEVAKHLVLIPIIHNEVKLGVVEISSFYKLEDYKVELIQRVTENVASGMAIALSNSSIQKMLKESQEQSEIMKANEEEMRQNLEEMQATQEELDRNRTELEKGNMFLNAMLHNLDALIYFKDTESKFLLVSNSMLQFFGLENSYDILGKSDFDFFTEEHAQPAFEDEQRIIKTKEPIINRLEKETHKNGVVKYVNTSKFPLKDDSGTVIGTFGISTDVTKLVEMEHEIMRQNDELKEQDEQLKKGLEELKDKQVQLEFENLLFTTLMDNINARITFKDKNAKYLRINKNKVNALGIKDQSEVTGLDDNDIFGGTHGKDFIEKEKANIAKGDLIKDNVELIRYKDGRLSWGSTSRIPLKNANDEIIGGLVITFDVTEQENALAEIKQLKTVINMVSSELPVVYFKVDKSSHITGLEGNAIQILNIDDSGDNLKELFPDLFNKIRNQEEPQRIEFASDIEIRNQNYIAKHLALPVKTTYGGYIGVIILEAK